MQDTNNDKPASLFSHTLEELSQWCERQGTPRYRAKQIFSWLYQKRVGSIDEMTDLPQALRDHIKNEFTLFESTIATHQIASDRTEKLLLTHRDGQQTECVLMREPDRNTICISTQVGCGMGCVFCASGMAGLSRNLSVAEIVEQAALLQRLLDTDERITNVVVMGMGEPLANLSNLIPTLNQLTAPDAFGMSVRRITVSTVGLPGKIQEFAKNGKPFNLAISLHAPNDELRNQIVPVNHNIGLKSILEASHEYFQQTGRRVTYEYILLGGINDHPDHARELVKLLPRKESHVNLIPMNAISQLPYQAPTRKTTSEFQQILEQAGIAATIRKRKGADIDAACGQLRLPSVTQLQVNTETNC